MKFRMLAAAAAAASMATAPAIAADRAAAPVEGESDMFGGPSIVIGLFALAAIIAGVVIAADGSDDDAVSP